MTYSRFSFLLFTFLTLVSLWGCSEGEVVPLVPSGNICERPLDRAWRDLNNICNSRNSRDAIWLEGEMPVVVGDGGLILECDDYSQWSVKELPLWDDLLVIAGNADGDLLTAGENGALAFRKNGNWQVMEPLEETTWRDVRAHGREMWLAGDHGSLARGIPGETWQMVGVPDSTDLLSVCACEDSVFVGGRQGVFRVLVDNQWEDVSWPELSTNSVMSIVRLDDGRLLVWASGLWIREAHGWVRTDYNSYSFDCHLKTRDGYLWLFTYYEQLRLDLSPDPWEETVFAGYGSHQMVAPGPDQRALVLGRDGEICWLSLDNEGNITKYLDPASYLDIDKIFPLSDGSVVFPTKNLLLEITTTGLNQINFLAPEVVANLRADDFIAGSSLENFYWVSEMQLRKIQNGEIVFELEIPEDFGYMRSIFVNSEEQVCLSLSRGILFWTGTQWETWSEGFSNQVYMTQYESFVGLFSSEAVYYSPDGPVSMPLSTWVRTIWEPEPGVFNFLNNDFGFSQWKANSGMSDLVYMDPLPGCTMVYPEVIVSTTAGVLLATSNNSIVLKFPDDPFRADWDLVAGPSMHEIWNLQVLADGSLVALGDYNSFIMLYPSSGY